MGPRARAWCARRKAASPVLALSCGADPARLPRPGPQSLPATLTLRVGSWTCGRSSSQSIVLQMPCISRAHCAFGVRERTTHGDEPWLGLGVWLPPNSTARAPLCVDGAELADKGKEISVRDRGRIDIVPDKVSYRCAGGEAASRRPDPLRRGHCRCTPLRRSHALAPARTGGLLSWCSRRSTRRRVSRC